MPVILFLSLAVPLLSLLLTSLLTSSSLSECGQGRGWVSQEKETEAKVPVPNIMTSHLCPSSCHALALAWTFSYLLFFRALSLLGLPTPTPFTNAVQLLLTLKVRLGEHYFF